MPVDAANKIAILAAVTNDDSNYCALSCTVTGGYTVDWGDGGAPENVASGVTAQHKYSFASLPAGTLTSEGFRQAMIVITPQAANPFTAVDLGKKHSRATLQGYSQPWIDLQLNAPSCTSFTTYSGVASSNLARANITAIGGVTNAASMFISCFSLASVSFPAGSLAALTNATNMFYQCFSLASVSFPAGSLAALTNATSMFLNCFSLASVSFPAGSLAALTNATNMFYDCYSLASVSFPAGSLAVLVTATSMFSSCSSLASVSFPAGALAALVTATSMFNNCASLASVTLPLAGINGSLVTTTTMFALCPTLSRIVNCTIAVTFSIASLKLARLEIVEIFTALPTITGQTITITSNHGVVDLSGADNAIATDKGWTIVA